MNHEYRYLHFGNTLCCLCKMDNNIAGSPIPMCKRKISEQQEGLSTEVICCSLYHIRKTRNARRLGTIYALSSKHNSFVPHYKALGANISPRVVFHFKTEIRSPYKLKVGGAIIAGLSLSKIHIFF